MKLPSFSLPASDGKTYTQEDFSKGKFVLFLYPKDMTSGCTLEAQNFRDAKQAFQTLGIEVFGVSKDSLKSHNTFCEKESLNFPLFSDEATVLIQALGSWKEKSLYGRKYFGTDRSTFLVVDGEIIHQWRGVKAKGHVEEVLDYAKNKS